MSWRPMSTRSRTARRLRRANGAPARDAAQAWFRQPIVWVGTAVLMASIVGCVWMILMAERFADPPLPVEGLQILKMPLAPASAPSRNIPLQRS